MADTLDPQIAAMMAQYQLPDDERKRIAIGNLLLGLGGGLMGARRGQEFNGIGAGLLGGVKLGQQAVQDERQARMQGLLMQGNAMDLLGKQQAYKDQQEARGIAVGMPKVAPPQPGPAQPFQTQGGATGQVNAALGNAPPAVNLPTQQLAQGSDPFTLLMTKADWLETNNKTNNPIIAKQAEQYREAALKFRDENQGFETVMKDGKPVLVQRRKFGGPQEQPYSPKPEYKALDTGSQTGFYDPLSNTWGGKFDKTMTPGETASNKVALGNLALAKNADARAAENQGKPVWDAQAGQFVYSPREGLPTGAAISPTGFTKPEKDLTVEQSKATAYASQMDDATKRLTALEKEGFSAKTWGQQQLLSMAGAPGIDYVPGSAFLPRALSGDKAQKYNQAQLQWTEAALRFMTGANAPEAEVIRNVATYFPRTGDDPALIKQKNEARNAMERSVRMAAGRGTAKLPTMGGAGGWSVTEVQ